MEVSTTTKNICIYIEMDCIREKEWLIANDWKPERKEAADRRVFGGCLSSVPPESRRASSTLDGQVCLPASWASLLLFTTSLAETQATPG